MFLLSRFLHLTIAATTVVSVPAMAAELNDERVENLVKAT